MRTQEFKIRICIALLIANLAFIWGNSLLPAELSQAFSDWVKSLLMPLGSGGEEAASGSGLLRKIAHFLEFASLGLLMSCLMQLRRKNRWYPLFAGFAAACTDETIQFFVPGRAPGFLDVGIDTCGVLTGMFLMQIGYVCLIRNQSLKFRRK